MKIVLKTWDDEIPLGRIEVKLEAPSKDEIQRAFDAYPDEMRKLSEFLQNVSNSDADYKRNRIGFNA